MALFKSILVPLDDTEISEGILPYVSTLAKGVGARILLLTVLDPGTTGGARQESEPGGVTAAAGPDSPRAGAVPNRSVLLDKGKAMDRAEEAALGRLTGIAEKLTGDGLEAEPRVTYGRPEDEILRVAEEECELVAMSTRGRSGLGRLILGSVTEKVIHTSPLPTLAVTPEKAELYRNKTAAISRIMVPLDGTALAETALTYAESLARLLSLSVILVRAVRVAGLYAMDAHEPPHVHISDLETSLVTEADDYLRFTAAKVRVQGIDVEWKVLRGSPTQAIVELARETPQDLIAITTRGRTGLDRWIMGSVAEAVVRASGDPVLVIPPSET